MHSLVPTPPRRVLAILLFGIVGPRLAAGALLWRRSLGVDVPGSEGQQRLEIRQALVDAAFRHFDVDGSGLIDAQEARGMRAELGLDEGSPGILQLDTVVAPDNGAAPAGAAMDRSITPREFAGSVMGSGSTLQNLAAATLRRFDTDGSGQLDSQEIDDLGAETGLDEGDVLHADANKDGAVSSEELEALVMGGGAVWPRPPSEHPAAVDFSLAGAAASRARKAAAVPTAEGAAARLTAGSGQVCGDSGLCSGHGTCNTETGTCECAGLFSGDTCEVQRCVGFLDVGQDCYGHGFCKSGTCECASGWGLRPGKSGPNGCQDRVCPIECADRGRCVDGVCICPQGWTGPICRDPQCPGGCSGHGMCSLVSLDSPGECTCDYGWGGAACSRVALYAELRGCPDDCSGNGLCLNGICACNVGFAGPSCAERACGPSSAGPDCELQRCHSDCHGQGLCFNGQCACWDAFAGRDCSVPVQCYQGCKARCEADEASEGCLRCVGQCSTLQAHPALGVHNPFEDLRGLLLQEAASAASPASDTNGASSPAALPSSGEPRVGGAQMA